MSAVLYTGEIVEQKPLDTTTGGVSAICIAPVAGKVMLRLQEAEAIAGAGLKGDRYAAGIGSFNIKRGGVGIRQVSFMNARFLQGTEFLPEDTRRNVFTIGVELSWLLPMSDKPGKLFRIGNVLFRAQKYLDPCPRPSKLSGKSGFKETFFDCGAIIAEVVEGGSFKVGDPVYHENKGY